MKLLYSEAKSMEGNEISPWDLVGSSRGTEEGGGRGGRAARFGDRGNPYRNL